MNKLSSPDRLDQIVEVIDPKGWIVLLVLLVIIGIGIFWSIFGSVATKVLGPCMLMKTGGVNIVSSGVSGKITDVSIDEGDFVRLGDTLFRVERGSLLQDIYFQRQQLQQEQDAALKKAELRKQTLINLQKNLETLEKTKKNKMELLKDGLVTQQSVFEIENQMVSTEKQIKDLDIEDLSASQALKTMEDKLEILLNQYEEAHNILSPYTGRVLSVDVNYDSIVNVGDPLASIELSGKNVSELEAVIYVPALEGKKIEPGMSLLISPSTVQPEEYGMMRGVVKSVSVFPATRQNMLKVLGDEKLVQQMSASGAPIAVEADLKPNSAIKSGYEWTSSKGPPIKINSGTFCNAFITIKEQRPISLVIPVFKKALGG